MDAEDREHPVVPIGEVERSAAALDRRADGEDPRHARVTRASDDCVGIVERIEMRVRVDHAGGRLFDPRKERRRRLDPVGRLGGLRPDAVDREVGGLAERVQNPWRRLG